MITTEQKLILWSNNDFKNDLKFATNVVAMFIEAEPNYGMDYLIPTDLIQVRIASYWRKRYSLANSLVQNPEDSDLFRMLMYAVMSGSFILDSPITFTGDVPNYIPWDAVNESKGLAGYIKEIWNTIAGVRSSEYPWAGENGAIVMPTWYGDHFANLPNRF